MIELARNPLVELPERRDGIVFAFHMVEGLGRRLVGWEAVETALADPSGFVWLHLDLSVRRAREWIAHVEQIPEDLRHELGASDVRTRLENHNGLMFGVFTDMLYDIDPDLTEISTVRIFGSERLVISARRHPSRTMDRLRRALYDGLRVRGPADLIATMIANLAETVEMAVVELIVALDDIEDRLLEGRVQLARVDVAVVQVTVDEVRIDLDDLFDQCPVRVGHRAEVAVTIAVVETVDHLLAARIRQVQRQALLAERGLDLL